MAETPATPVSTKKKKTKKKKTKKKKTTSSLQITKKDVRTFLPLVDLGLSALEAAGGAFKPYARALRGATALGSAALAADDTSDILEKVRALRVRIRELENATKRRSSTAVTRQLRREMDTLLDLHFKL